MGRASILVVDDDPAAAQYLSLALREAGYEVRLAENGVRALLALEAAPPDLILSDLQMPVMDGMDLLRHTKQRWPEIPFIIITVAQDVATVVDAVKIGAVNFILKPASPASILNAVQKALSTPALKAQDHAGVPEMIGSSKAIVEVRHLIALASRSDVNVLITGRTGTGKELAARAIHRCSRLAGGPFIAHNCAATPPDLFESQFFGHRRGAFTGADQDQIGLFERAHGGILFLDELESLSLSHQAKLLRVLDDGEIRPVGSTEVRRLRVRLLAATNQEPGPMIAGGSLREDIYYRLRGLEIRLPLLIERPEDIPLLADHFLGETSASLTAEARETLTRYSWPGNVRQLRNVIYSAAALAGGRKIGAHHLIFEPHTQPGATDAVAAPPTATGTTLRELERQAVMQALRDHSGNRSRAARVLGIDRSTLRRKMAEYGIKGLSEN